jgi:serine/threonine protein kinase/type II secretory pathway pseudopilin PulG
MKTEDWQRLKEVFYAIVDLPEFERAAVLEKYEEDIRNQVEKLITANEEADDFMVEPAFIEAGFSEENETDFYVGGQIGSYKILEEIGHGGMGTVYLAARRDDFEKRVALKLIKRGMDTNSVLKRFVLERQILARLEHPNIANLLDGGSTDDGLPYLVMEYIEGEPIIKYCDSRNLDIFERLELFQKVCAAVSYAHQNLVVHRDLKPSNILVTQDRTPKLLDFGIAKLLHSDWSLDTNEATATMFRVMTPEYASPEQISGLPVTTTSDVYSLGVVLYELLTGERPYKIKSRLPEEVARIVLTKEPVKPSAVSISQSEADTLKQTDTLTASEGTNRKSQIANCKSLRGDLDNIILKALRKEPERRYASVQEFSEDIRRHLAGLPVTATADTAVYRLNKFVKRHRAGVLAGGLVFLTLLAAIAVTSWQAIVARREQAKAEQRFNQVRQLANTVLFEYHDRLAKLTGSTPLREKMVKDALRYLDNLAAENINDASLQSELASAYFKVGEVQGAPSKSSLGDYGGGLESFRKSLAIREKLFRENPNSEQIKLDLTRSYQMVGDLSQVTDNIPAALENYGRAFALFDSIRMENQEARLDFAGLHTRFAQALAASGELPEAIENFRKAIAILNELSTANPDNRELRRELGVARVLLGDALEESGDLNEALATQRSAFAVLEPLVTDADAQSQRAAMSAFGRIGDVLFKLGKYREALEIQLKSLAADERTLAADPQNALARRDVQVDFHKIALNYSGLGQMNEALASERRTVGFCEQAVAANPESSESRGDLSVAYYHYAEMWEKSGNLREALNYFKKATEIEEANSNADPTNTTAMSNLSESYLKVGGISLKIGNRSEALRIFLKGVEIREKLAANNQETAQDRPISAKLYESLGDYYFLQDKQQAKTRYEQSLVIWQDLQRENTILASDAKKPDEVRQKIEKCRAKLK